MARQRKRRGKPIDGILILDKPKGMSSNRALQRCKRLYQAQKAGHTGALDPLATGVLPICFGEATKLSQYWLDSDKTYEVVAKLGEVTDTLDADGEILQQHDVPELSIEAIEHVIQNYVGDIEQIPPLYSALKYQGRPLYELAREGIDVDIERKRRVITIYSIELIDWQMPLLTLKVHCSKGTYVRTLVDDIGKEFTCGAHVLELRRLRAGFFDIEQVLTLDELESSVEVDGKEDALIIEQDLKQKLWPIERATQDWPQLILNQEQASVILHGQTLDMNNFQNDDPADFKIDELIALFKTDDSGAQPQFIGLGQMKADGKLRPRRLVRSPNDA